MGVSRIKIAPTIDRWFSRGANAVSFWPLVPSGVVGAVGAYLASGVALIAQYGALGWLVSGISAFAVSAVGFAALAKARLWKIEATSRARLLDSSSAFDPMVRIYEGKRLFLRDLAPVGRRQVIGKKFINCEIIGPGTVILGSRSTDQKPFPVFRECLTFDVDCVQIDPALVSSLAIGFPDCDFENCSFYHMTLLFMFRENETLNWITPDFRQPPLPSPVSPQVTNEAPDGK